MDVSAAVFTHCWVGIAAAGHNAPADPEASDDTTAHSFPDKSINRGRTFVRDCQFGVPQVLY